MPEMYRHLHDDFAPNPEEWDPEPVDSPFVAYVNITENGYFLGMAVILKHSEVQVEIHNALSPHVGWKKRVQVGRAMFAWLWRAGRKRIIGKVVSSNRYALKYNEFIGMERFGVNRSAFMQDGVLLDEVWFGVSAPVGGVD